MKLLWEVDDHTRVEATLGVLGKEIVSVNGALVHNRRRLGSRSAIAFQLPDGRAASLTARAVLIGYPQIELRVEGQLLAATGKLPLNCEKCRVVVKANDRFCAKCGHTQPTPEQRGHEKQLKEATGAIKVLAALYALSGGVLFLVTRAHASDVLGKLRGADPRLQASVALSNPAGGSGNPPGALSDLGLTVGELRTQLLWEPWAVLIVNLILAAVMVALAMWGRRSPLPAMLVATATYAVVIVANAIADPRTLAQGLLLKVIMIAFLMKGIKAALALRTTHA